MNSSENSEVFNSLVDFFQKNIRSRLSSDHVRILELGSGVRSQFADISLPHASILAIDRDERKCEFAEAVSGVTYMCADISAESFLDSIQNEKFDLVFDSHCIHCIVEPAERAWSFHNIKASLKDEGLFCAEMMIQSKRKELDVIERHVPHARELEEELIAAGFRLKFFSVSRNLSFELNTEQGLNCDLVRMIATK